MKSPHEIPEPGFNRRELKLVWQLYTPRQVQDWIENLDYNWEPDGRTYRTFRGVVQSGRAHCVEAALVAATILEQYGHAPLLLNLHSQDHLDHVVFLVHGPRGWGAVGRSRISDLQWRSARFRCIRDLVMSYFDPFIDATGRIIGYSVGDLRQLGNYNWRLSDRNVWKVDRFLEGLTTLEIRGSDRRYQRQRRRYLQTFQTDSEVITNYVIR